MQKIMNFEQFVIFVLIVSSIKNYKAILYMNNNCNN